jgi:hypothetical protein
MSGALMPLVVTPDLIVIEVKKMLLAAFGTFSAQTRPQPRQRWASVRLSSCEFTYSMLPRDEKITDVCPVHKQQLVNMDHSLEPMDNERPLSAFDVKESSVLSLVILEDRTLQCRST